MILKNFDAFGCLSYVKDTILKANHNTRIFRMRYSLVVYHTSKIQFWKQITTSWWCSSGFLRLFIIRQRYNFESKSQQGHLGNLPRRSCLSYVKDTILKANHNCWSSNSLRWLVVYHTSKIQFWKQITTLSMKKVYLRLLFIIRQRYNFESKSQQKC